jgi:perosamine synthetase
VLKALDDGWISGTGPTVAAFEHRLSERVRCHHAIATANGTLALELALRALEIGPGDEVVVPAFTFAAPAMSVLAVGATPVLADVDYETWTLSPTSVADVMTSRTKAILAVDVMGHPADYDALYDFGVPVIEDAAEAHGAFYKGRPTGSLGDVSVFSFHANKAIVTGEGGSACTNSNALAERMRLIANHGMRSSRPYWHPVVGRNYRMTNLTAAIGLAQLDRWDELIAARRRVSSWYDQLLSEAACEARPVADWAEASCWLHTITVLDRETVLREVRAADIDARAVWPSLTHQPVLAGTAKPCPVSEDLAGRAMWLPTHNALCKDDVVHIANAVKTATAALPLDGQ